MNKALVAFLFAAPLLLAQTPATDADKPRVFITDSQSWSLESNSGGGGGAFASHMAGGARPQTAEIVKTFGQRCPQVVTNNRQEKADYIVVLDHEGGKGFVRHKNKVAVFNRISGDSVVSKSTVSLGGSVQDACEAITKDWAARAKDIRAAEVAATAAQPAPASADHVAADAPVRLAEQSSAAPTPAAPSQTQVQISSTPDAADIEIDGSFVGSTPSTVGVAAGQHEISVKKTGFKPWERKITVSSGQVNVNAVLEPEQK